MDQQRQIRFAIPPFLLAASLVWGAYLSGCHFAWIFQHGSKDAVIALLASIAAATIPVGYLISTVSVLLLRGFGFFSEGRTYEASLCNEAFAEIWKRLDISLKMDKKKTLYAVTTFDHEILDKSIHDWLFRRWNSFYVAANSAVALMLAFFAPCIIPIHAIHWTRWWAVCTLVLVGALGYAAFDSWREVMRMLEFQAHRLLRTDLQAAK